MLKRHINQLWKILQKAVSFVPDTETEDNSALVPPVWKRLPGLATIAQNADNSYKFTQGEKYQRTQNRYSHSKIDPIA